MTRHTASLGALLPTVRGGFGPRQVLGDTDVAISGITHDSRRVGPGSIFCCVPGTTTDGHDHAGAAVEAGAAALLCERPLGLAVAEVIVDDVRQAMGPFSAAVYGHPTDRLTVVGVTGTNGKTTTAHVLGDLLAQSGRRTAVLGTLTGVFTTPEATDLQARFAELVDEETDSVVMEVSSHALALHRVLGTRFRVAVFTNLGRDHLDFHGTEERYFAAKALLFASGLSETGVVNVDDVHGRLLADSSDIEIVGFGLDDVTDVEIGPRHHAYTWRGLRVRVGLGGRFNVMNSLAAATAASVLGLSDDDIVEALAHVPPVPGRFEAVDAGQPFAVIVDYAHTPDGLREALGAAAASAPGGRVILVFGCGGDRDRDKRPEMGAVGASLADEVVITSDNPRSEDPDEIIAAVLSGVSAELRRKVAVNPDRRAAIASALDAARPGDVVLLAGKGHETTQTTGSRVVPFDDRAVARELLGGAA